MITDTAQLSLQEQRALALAGLLQATLLVERTAFGKETPEDALSVLYESLYATEPDLFSDIVPDMDGLTLGITYLRTVLQQQPSDSDNRILAYVLKAIQLEKQLRKRNDMITHILTRLGQMQAQYETQEDRLQPNAVAELGKLYSKTLGELRPRVEVKGAPEELRQNENAAKIRSLLLTAIRFAMLWHQLGGRRWHLVFRQRQIVANLNQLYGRLSHKQLLH